MLVPDCLHACYGYCSVSFVGISMRRRKHLRTERLFLAGGSDFVKEKAMSYSYSDFAQDS